MAIFGRAVAVVLMAVRMRMGHMVALVSVIMPEVVSVIMRVAWGGICRGVHMQRHRGLCRQRRRGKDERHQRGKCDPPSRTFETAGCHINTSVWRAKLVFSVDISIRPETWPERGGVQGVMAQFGQHGHGQHRQHGGGANPYAAFNDRQIKALSPEQEPIFVAAAAWGWRLPPR